jgi:hypothetical protein
LSQVLLWRRQLLPQQPNLQLLLLLPEHSSPPLPLQPHTVAIQLLPSEHSNLPPP